MLSRHQAAWPAILFVSVLAFTRAQAVAAEGKGDEATDPNTKVQKLNRYAMQLFDDQNYALAEKTLLEALAIVEKSSLGSGPAALATNGNLAVLYSVALKNPDKAVLHFKKALAIKPDLKMSKQRATPETEANLARAKAEMAGGNAKAPQPAHSPAAAESRRAEHAPSLVCPSGQEVQAGEEITLQCTTSPDLKAATVALHYKRNGEDDYQVVEMSKSPGSDGTATWVAKIPAADTHGRWVPVYFEARDDRGAALAFSGREDSPNVITVRGNEAPPPVEEESEEADDEREEIDDNNPLARLENERRREHQGSKGTFWFSLGLGTGFGYAGGNATETFPSNKVGFNPGLAMAYLGHAVPELGYFVGRNTALAITGRNQWVYGGWKGTPTGAHAVLLRILFFGDDEGKTRWYFAGAAGWGHAFRFQVKALVLNNSGDSSGVTIKDTVKGGPWVVGTGTGMHYKLSRHWRWTIDSQLLVGFSHVSAVLDITTGLRVQF